MRQQEFLFHSLYLSLSLAHDLFSIERKKRLRHSTEWVDDDFLILLSDARATNFLNSLRKMFYGVKKLISIKLNKKIVRKKGS